MCSVITNFGCSATDYRNIIFVKLENRFPCVMIFSIKKLLLQHTYILPENDAGQLLVPVKIDM